MTERRELEPGKLRYMRIQPTEEQCKKAAESELYAAGDMVLIWANEGDLLHQEVFPRTLPTGYVMVPEEPTPEMIAAACPIYASEEPDQKAKEIGAAAVLILNPDKSISMDAMAVRQAALMVMDYRAMLAAASEKGNA